MSLDIYSSPEHEFEAEFGLPERLPKGERILWQGSPDTKTILAKVFHIKFLSIYFGLLLAYRLVTGLRDGEPVATMLSSVLMIVALSGLGLGLISLIGYLIASTAVYTITNKRIVMRIGIVLNMTFNFPLKRIESADCGFTKEGSGDIYLKLSKGTKIAIFHLWPHARPGKWSTPQPTLRCIKNCTEVAQILVDAWAQENNVIARSIQANQPQSIDTKTAYSEVEAA
jgi:Bacterial PH domain